MECKWRNGWEVMKQNRPGALDGGGGDSPVVLSDSPVHTPAEKWRVRLFPFRTGPAHGDRWQANNKAPSRELGTGRGFHSTRRRLTGEQGNYADRRFSSRVDCYHCGTNKQLGGQV